MSETNEVDTALANLEAIKQGEDPRSSTEEPETTDSSDSDPPVVSDDALQVVEQEVERLYDEHDLGEHLRRDKIHVAVARWRRKNGVCIYHETPDKKRFGKRRQTSTDYGHHTIIINEKIMEEGNRDGFIDTVRHELAHALAYAMNGRSQGHNHNWKELASKLGADPKSCHDKKETEYDYFIYCPNCGSEGGRTKRSKVIKLPFTRVCAKCGHNPLSSYEAGQDPPEESGVVAVESIPWDCRSEWLRHR